MCRAGYSIFVNPGELFSFSDSFVIRQQIPLLWIQLFFSPHSMTFIRLPALKRFHTDSIACYRWTHHHHHPCSPTQALEKDGEIALTSSQHIRTSILSGAALCHSQKSIWYRHQIDEIRIHQSTEKTLSHWWGSHDKGCTRVRDLLLRKIDWFILHNFCVFSCESSIYFYEHFSLSSQRIEWSDVDEWQ